MKVKALKEFLNFIPDETEIILNETLGRSYPSFSLIDVVYDYPTGEIQPYYGQALAPGEVLKTILQIK